MTATGITKKNNVINSSNSRIIYVQYTNPAGYPPLEHSSQILAKHGWEIIFLGTGALGASALSFPPHPKIQIKQMDFCPGGWRQKIHYVQFGLWVLFWTLRWQPKWIYASDLLSCPISLFLSFLPGVKVIYHEHDSPSQTSNSIVERFCLWSRQKLARRTEFCILPNQERIKYFTQQTNRDKTTLCVWNCSSIEEVSRLSTFEKAQDIWLYYHGSIVPTQLPKSLLEALAMLPDIYKLRIIGYETVGHIGYVKELQETAIQLGISERLQFLGSISSRTKLLEYCCHSNIGIALFTKPTREPMTGASNKPFDYLACGLALLVCDLPDWQQMYVEPGYGLACDPDNANSIAEALSWLIEHSEQMKEMGEKGRRKIATEWNYEKQFQPVLEILNQSI